MKNEINQTLLDSQHFPTGMALDDNNIEFVGCKETKTVIWMQNGRSRPFHLLPSKEYNMLKELFLSDQEAVKAFCKTYPKHEHNLKRLVEIYTCYMYGQFDQKPDIKNGKLQACENFRDSQHCISLKFDHKYIDIDGVPLSNRDLMIIDRFIKGDPDKSIASDLGIAITTLDFHKKNLYVLVGANSKIDVVVKALKNNLLCEA